jgi:hypothetical protein
MLGTTHGVLAQTTRYLVAYKSEHDLKFARLSQRAHIPPGPERKDFRVWNNTRVAPQQQQRQRLE